MMKKISDVFKQNGLLRFITLYGFFYLIAFFWLEGREVEINIVSSKWDSLIPFCEYFVIPYFMWFVYIAFTLIHFVFFCREKHESKRFIYSFCGGMTVFLLVSYIYPNGHNLRPELVGDSIFISMMRFLHWVDTPTNILPSMHVFVTVACTIALLRDKSLCRHKGFRQGILLCSILIILSTLFLKQHSVVDVILALLLNLVCYICFYKIMYEKQMGTTKFKRKQFT